MRDPYFELLEADAHADDRIERLDREQAARDRADDFFPAFKSDARAAVTAGRPPPHRTGVDVSTISMTEKQVGALHDLTVAFGAEVDVTEEQHRSLAVTVYTPTPDDGRLAVAAFSMSAEGTVRSRDRVVA